MLYQAFRLQVPFNDDMMTTLPRLAAVSAKWLIYNKLNYNPRLSYIFEELSFIHSDHVEMLPLVLNLGKSMTSYGGSLLPI